MTYSAYTYQELLHLTCLAKITVIKSQGMIAPPLKIQSCSQVMCQPRFLQNDIKESYNKGQSLGSQNMTNMFCRIIQDLISTPSLTGSSTNSCSKLATAVIPQQKWDMIFANAKLLTKQMGYNTN